MRSLLALDARRGLRGVQTDREAAAAVRAAVDLERAAVRDDDRAREGQAEAAAARVAAAPGVEPHKRLEDAPDVGRIDPDARVLDDEGHTLARPLQRDHHAAAGRRVLDGIVDQVQQRAAERTGVALHYRGRRRAHAHRDTLALGQPHTELERLETQGLEVHRLAARGEADRGSREQQQVFGEADELVDLFDARGEDPAILAGRALGTQGDLDAA